MPVRIHSTSRISANRIDVARALGGHVRQNGAIAFPGPGRKLKDRSCTLTLDPKAPDGFVVADARCQIDWRALKDFVRKLLALDGFTRGDRQ